MNKKNTKDEKRSDVIKKLQQISQDNNSKITSITKFESESLIVSRKTFNHQKARKDLKTMVQYVTHRSEFIDNFIALFNNALKDHDCDGPMSAMQIYVQGYVEGLQDFYCVNTVRDIEKLGKKDV